jgi:glycine/D-amino acid oxidase-like deaminating enzyme
VSTPAIVIIGGGVGGLSAALGAAELGCSDVVVLERQHLASGSSALSAGVYNIQATDPLNVEIRVKARRLLDLYERENGLHVSRIGHLRLGRRPENLELFAETIELQRELGEETSHLLEPEEARRVVPHLRIDDVLGAIFNPRDGHIDGPLLCNVLAERAQALGVRVVPRAEVVRAGRTAGGRHRLTTATDEAYEADVVMNAAGPWAQRVGGLLGAPLPMVNQVHDIIKVKLPPAVDYVVPMVQEYIPGDEEAVYFRQDGPDSLIAGMHTYDVVERFGAADPDDYRKTVSWEAWEEASVRVSERLLVDGLGFERGWTGLYPLSADGQYVVGPYAADDSIIAVGGFGAAGVNSGITLGRVAAEWAIFGEARTLRGAEQLLPDRDSLSRGPATRA